VRKAAVKLVDACCSLKHAGRENVLTSWLIGCCLLAKRRGGTIAGGEVICV